MDFMLCKLEQTLRSLEQCAVVQIQPLEERLTAPDPLKRHVPEAFLDACETLTFVDVYKRQFPDGAIRFEKVRRRFQQYGRIKSIEGKIHANFPQALPHAIAVRLRFQ